MTKAVRNSASEMTTELGGAVAVPSAVRNSDSTTTMRVNEVIITRIDGASDSTVISTINWMMRSLRPPVAAPWPKLMLISCAASGVADTISAATEAATVLNRTRRPSDLIIQLLFGGRPSKLVISCWRLSISVVLWFGLFSARAGFGSAGRAGRDCGGGAGGGGAAASAAAAGVPDLRKAASRRCAISARL